MLVFVARLDAASLYHDQLFGVQTTSNVVYGQGLVQNGASSESLELDVYRPVQGSTPLPAETPAIVLVHGGGFFSGDKTDMAPLAEEYASLGYVVVSINYRMYGDLPPNSSPGPADNFTPPPAGYDTFPDLQLGGNAINAAVQDSETAMTWLRTTQPPTASTRTASASAVRPRVASRPNSSAITMCRPIPHRRSCSTFWEACTARKESFSPGAPAFMFHGDADTQVPFAGDLAVANQLTAVGVYHEFYEGVGIGHELDTTVLNMQFGNETLLQHNIDFLANHLVPEPSTIVLVVTGTLAAGLAVRRRRNVPGRG